MLAHTPANLDVVLEQDTEHRHLYLVDEPVVRPGDRAVCGYVRAGSEQGPKCPVCLALGENE